MGKTEFLELHKEERQPVEVWSRVMGYMRSYNSFNYGKKSEFKQRIFYKVKDTMNKYTPDK